MNENIYEVTADGFKRIFQESLSVHPSSYDPTQDLRELPTDKTGTVRCHLPLEAKALRFFRYCEENNKLGRICTSNYRIDPFTTAEAGLVIFVSATAEVYIDDILVGSAAAGQACRVSDGGDIDNIIQFTSGNAKSRALTNAGFGIVSGTDVDATLRPVSGNAPMPFIVGPSDPTAGFQPSVQGGYPPNPAANAMPTVAYQPPATVPNIGNPNAVQTDPQVNLFQQLGGQNDALTQAKTLPYPLSGYYQGKTLGSLNTKTLESFVSKPHSDPTVVTAQNAAKLILEDRKKANGKTN